MGFGNLFLIIVGVIVLAIIGYRIWKQRMMFKHPDKFPVLQVDGDKGGSLFSSNKDFDSTILLVGILVGFLGLLAASIFVPKYAESKAAVEILDIFKFVFGAMALYFFKSKDQNGQKR